MTVNAIPVNPSVSFGGYLHFNNEVAKTAAYAVKAKESGTLYTNTAAVASVTFTLPAITPLLFYGFLVVAGQNVLVTSNEGTNIVTFNNASATTLAFQTAGQLIGGCLVLWANQAGSKWYATAWSTAGNIITVS